MSNKQVEITAIKTRYMVAYLKAFAANTIDDHIAQWVFHEKDICETEAAAQERLRQLLYSYPTRKYIILPYYSL